MARGAGRARGGAGRAGGRGRGRRRAAAMLPRANALFAARRREKLRADLSFYTWIKRFYRKIKRSRSGISHFMTAFY